MGWRGEGWVEVREREREEESRERRVGARSGESEGRWE